MFPPRLFHALLLALFTMTFATFAAGCLKYEPIITAAVISPTPPMPASAAAAPVARSTESPTSIPLRMPLTAAPTQMLVPVPTGLPPPPLPSSTNAGNPTGAPSYSISDNYYPTMIMGDIGDVSIGKFVGYDHFTYEAQGRGPHEWEYKYIGGTLNPLPARFGGVGYLNKPGNFGREPGRDLTAFRHVLKWEARSVSDPIIIEFSIGGIVWVWDENTKTPVAPPYKDSMPLTPLGRATLTNQWQSFEYVLDGMPEDNFKSVINGFSWVITWDSNGVKLNPTATPPAAMQSKTFEIEIRNIRYER